MGGIAHLADTQTQQDILMVFQRQLERLFYVMAV